MVRLHLTRKLAARLNGVDLSHVKVGDYILVPNAAAAMLIQEGWAELVSEPESADRGSLTQPPEVPGAG